MALIDNSYAPPGTYVTQTFNATTPQLNAAQRLPVLIGEGVEQFTFSDVELVRGSSATVDNRVVGDNLSDQVTGQTRTYQLSHFPVVTGDGSGTVTNDPTKVTLVADNLPVTVLSLNGETGQVTVQSLIPEGANLVGSYYFKKTDTKVLNEDASGQVPAFATLAIPGNELTLSLSIPGALGNNVTLALTLAATGQNLGVSDLLAVTGVGTNAISIELRKPDDSTRTFQDLINLTTAGISTLDGGYLTVASKGTSLATAAAAMTATAFSGGAGQSTNTVFKTTLTPIVDGSNGGVVTTDPSKVQVVVNGNPVTVTAVDGANGLITVANGVAYGSTVELTYFTNKYQDTADLLPGANIASIVKVGYGPSSSNFTEGVDFVLNGNTISWGASATISDGVETAGFTPFDATQITTTLVDEKVFLRPLSGAVSGRNSVFTFADSPVDGSGLGRATDNPALVSIYVGANPSAALQAGPVKVARLSGASAQVTLYNPPAQGNNVYATYYRSVLNDHQFTVAVKVPGAPGQGTYGITDENNQVVPVAKAGTATVTDANFTTTGIVWPSDSSDLAAAIGGASETVTITFQNDSLQATVTPAVQASLIVKDSGNVSKIQFTATTPGVGGNSVTITMVGGPTGAPDASAISVAGDAVTVETVKADNSTVRTWQEIVGLFATYPPTTTDGGVILCSGVANADLTSQSVPLAATHLAGGVAAVTTPYANRFLVTTSRTAAQALSDGLGLTGGATTPGTSNVGSNAVGAVGYLGQTYIDPNTALRFTVVEPQSALSYGFTQLPSPAYRFQPGDTLTFTVSATEGFVTGSTPTIAIPGLQTKVVTTLGCNAGDNAVITTFNRAGNSPAVGDYYYVTYTANKSASDMAIQVFTKASDAYAVYGQPSVQNRLSLAIKLFLQNAGNQQFACIQVPQQAGLGVAADQDFINAIQSLATPLQGSGRRANVIVPLSTSANVQQALSVFLNKQATPRLKGWATGFIGFDQYANANAMQATARAIANQRVRAVGLNALGISLIPANSTVAVESMVTGEFLAAAYAGLSLASGNDVATDLSGQAVVGFTRSMISYDETTMNQMAAAGITCLFDSAGALEVRDDLTTSTVNILAKKPYVTLIADYISQAFLKLTKQFRGRKMTSDLAGTIQGVLNAQLAQWNSNNQSAILSGYGQLTVVFDPDDPTSFDINVLVKPMFSALYFNVGLTISLN